MYGHRPLSGTFKASMDNSIGAKHRNRPLLVSSRTSTDYIICTKHMKQQLSEAFIASMKNTMGYAWVWTPPRVVYSIYG